MTRARDELMLQLLQACADRAPEPLYPAHYAREENRDRDQIDVAFDELRKRGLVVLTDWVRELGQGRALTDAGKQALQNRDLSPVAPSASAADNREPTLYERGELARNALYRP